MINELYLGRSLEPHHHDQNVNISPQSHETLVVEATDCAVSSVCIISYQFGDDSTFTTFCHHTSA
ncbi:hypothetical protein J6590_041915 [Homalodisca vitripennis]|nr:hypothetical protein J6590_041915 [Homalodisca vitripennis]